MSLTAGEKIGSYEVQNLLGAGGRGEVYRARDSKLKRDVAIKILPETFSRNLERVARFQREAEVLASLNHPNIATISDVQEWRHDGKEIYYLDTERKLTVVAVRTPAADLEFSPPVPLFEVEQNSSAGLRCGYRRTFSRPPK